MSPTKAHPLSLSDLRRVLRRPPGPSWFSLRFILSRCCTLSFSGPSEALDAWPCLPQMSITAVDGQPHWSLRSQLRIQLCPAAASPWLASVLCEGGSTSQDMPRHCDRMNFTLEFWKEGADRALSRGAQLCPFAKALGFFPPSHLFNAPKGIYLPKL